MYKNELFYLNGKIVTVDIYYYSSTEDEVDFKVTNMIDDPDSALLQEEDLNSDDLRNEVLDFCEANYEEL